MWHQPNVLAILLALPLLAIISAAAVADEVHLTNGRTMFADRTEVLGDRLVIYQGTDRFEIPMALVLRVVETGPAPQPEPTETPAPPARQESEGEAAGTEAQAAAGAAAAEAATEEPAEDETPPEQTEAYWQDRVRAIEEEKAALDVAIEELRREERAFLFSHRSTATTREKLEAAQARQQELDKEMDDLRREARRLNIPPGWLRVR